MTPSKSSATSFMGKQRFTAARAGSLCPPCPRSAVRLGDEGYLDDAGGKKSRGIDANAAKDEVGADRESERTDRNAREQRGSRDASIRVGDGKTPRIVGVQRLVQSHRFSNMRVLFSFHSPSSTSFVCRDVQPL